MTIFYIVAGICLMGILVALWLMQKEAEQATSVGIQKIAPEEIKAYDPQTETVNGGTLTTKQAPAKKAAKPKKSRVPLKGLFGKDTSGDISVRLDAIEAAPEMPESKPKKKSFLQSLALRKTKKSPVDDIPRPTTFPGLEKKPDIELPPEQGTASMWTGAPRTPSTEEPSLIAPHHQPLPIEKEVQQTKSAASGHQDISSRQREHLATVQLDELKQKYERLEKLFQEKSTQFAQAESQLEGELKNREDFFKLKTILESEIHDVKDRARDLQNTLKNAQMETEQQKVQAQQLRDKVQTLEEEIQQKNTTLEPSDAAPKDPAKPPPGLPLDKLIEQTRREEAEKKEGSPEENPVLNLPQDQKSDPHSPSSDQPTPPQESPSVPREEPQPNPGSDDPQSEDKRF